MLDTEEQLARLKQRIAAIDGKYAGRRVFSTPAEAVPRENTSARWFIEEWSEGQVVTNEFGAHFQTERLFAGHRPHGSADIGALAELPVDLLNPLGGGEVEPA